MHMGCLGPYGCGHTWGLAYLWLAVFGAVAARRYT